MEELSLLRSQILDSCKLALPEGLKDLMSDITREVLRAEPLNLHGFIADYLAAMLEARDALSIACRICQDVCECSCQPELEEELINAGLKGEDLETARNVILEHFNQKEVNEGNLMMKLLKKTNLDMSMVPSIQKAVRGAFIKNHLSNLKIKKTHKATEATEAGHNAAGETMMFYKKLYTDENYLEKIDKQANFGGYLASPDSVETMDSTSSKNMMKIRKATASKEYPIADRLSSVCLAGSFINLPKYVPYSAYENSQLEQSEHETIHKNIDYSYHHDSVDEEVDNGQNIFQDHTNLSHKTCSCEDDKTEGYIEEEISEDVQSEVSSVEEDIIKDNYQFAAGSKEGVLQTQILKEVRKQEVVKNISNVFGEPISKHASYFSMKLVPHEPSQDSIPLKDVEYKILMLEGRPSVSKAHRRDSKDCTTTSVSKRDEEEIAAIEACSISSVPSATNGNTKLKKKDSYHKLLKIQPASKDFVDTNLVERESKAFVFERKGVSFSNLLENASQQSSALGNTTPKRNSEGFEKFTQPSTSSTIEQKVTNNLKTVSDSLQDIHKQRVSDMINKYEQEIPINVRNVSDDMQSEHSGTNITNKEMISVVGDDMFVATEQLVKVLIDIESEHGNLEEEVEEDFLEETTYKPDEGE